MSRHAIQAQFIKAAYEGYALGKVEPLAELTHDARVKILENDINAELTSTKNTLLEKAVICLYLAKAIDNSASKAGKPSNVSRTTLSVFTKNANAAEKQVLAELEKEIIGDEPAQPTSPASPAA